jgi:hypothetical protein
MEEYNLVTLNSIEQNLTPFSLSRTRENLKRPVFIVIGSVVKDIKTIIDYLVVWINMSLKKISIDSLQTFHPKDIRNDKTYVFNLSNIESIIKDESLWVNRSVNTIVQTSICSYLIDNCGPMIWIGSKLSDIPVQIRDLSSATFVCPSDDFKKVLDGVSTFQMNEKLRYKQEDVIVFDKMTCDNKLSVFQNIFC